MRTSDPFRRKPRQNPRPQAGTPGSARALDSVASSSTPTFPQIAQYPLFPQVGRGIMPVAAFSEAAGRIQVQSAAAEAERARELLSHHAASTSVSPSTTSVPGSTAPSTQTAESADTSMLASSTTESDTVGQVQHISATEAAIQSIFAPYMTQPDTDMTSAEVSSESGIVPASDLSAFTTPLNINSTITTSSPENERPVRGIERSVTAIVQSQNRNLELRILDMAQEAREARQKHDMDMNYHRGRDADLEQLGRDKTLSIKKLEKEVEKLELQLEEKGEIIDMLALAGEQAENNATHHENEVMRLTQELSASQTTLQAQTLVYQEHVATLRQEAVSTIASLEQRISSLQQGITQQTDAENEELRARNTELETQLANHTNELAHLRNQAEARVQEDHEKLIFLEGQRNQALGQLETTASDLTKSRNEHSALQSEHDGLIQQYGEIQRSRDQQTEQIVVQRRLKDEALASTAAVVADRDDLRATVATLEQNLATTRAGGLKSIQAYNDAANHIRDLDEKITEYQQQEQVWLAQNQKLQSTQAQLDEALEVSSSLTETAERIEDVKEVYKEKMGVLERESASKDTRIRKLEAKIAANEEENRPSSSHTYISRNLSPVHGEGFASLATELQDFSPLVSPNRQHFEHIQEDMLEQGSQTKVQELDFSGITTVIDREPIETPVAAKPSTRQPLSFSNTMVVAMEEPVEPIVNTALPTRQRLGFSGNSTLHDEEPIDPQVIIRTISRPNQQLSLSATHTLLDEDPLEQHDMPVLHPLQQLGFSSTSTILNEEPHEEQNMTVSRPLQQLSFSVTNTILNEEPIESRTFIDPRPLQQLSIRRPSTILDLSPVDVEAPEVGSRPEGFGITPVKVKPVETTRPRNTPAQSQATRQRLGFAMPQTILSEAPVDAVLPQPQVLPGRISTIYQARSSVGRFADRYCPSPLIPALLALIFLVMAWNWFTASAEHAKWLASNELARSSVVKQRDDGAGLIYAYGPAQWLVALVRGIVVFCWTLPHPMSGGAIEGKMFGLAANVAYGSSLVY